MKFCFVLFSLKTRQASRLCCARIITGTACYLALWFALPLLALRFALSSLPTSVPPTSVHLSQIHLSLCSSQPVSPIFGRGMLRGATCAFWCAGLPSSTHILHPAAVGPESLCWSQRGRQDNLFLELVSKTHPWTWIWEGGCLLCWPSFRSLLTVQDAAW